MGTGRSMPGGWRRVASGVLTALVVLLGIAATPPGYMLAIDPSGSLLRLPFELRGPFPDFRIPGIVLGNVLGLQAFLVAAALVFRPGWPRVARLNPLKGRHWTRTWSAVLGALLVGWVVIQVGMIGFVSWLQPTCFGLGLAILALSFVKKEGE